MYNEDVCEYLKWDSDFFGRRIAHAKPSRLTRETVKDILFWCEQKQIDCLYFLADSSDPQTSKVAESNKFNFVDIRVTLESLIETVPTIKSAPLEIREAQESDIPALRAMARTNHKDSRFYYDGKFPEVLCDALYETWIEKSCRGWARKVLVGVDAGTPMGYVTCEGSRSCPTNGKIGLIGVGSGSQRTGAGTLLVNQALHWFNQQGIKRVTVVTQGRNVPAQRLYQRSGFLARSVELWYHRWFDYNGKQQSCSI